MPALLKNLALSLTQCTGQDLTLVAPGTAAPHLVMGGKVQGGLYGSAPTLKQLDAGNLRYTTDYRRLYATIVRRWWQLSEARWQQRFQAMDWV